MISNTIETGKPLRTMKVTTSKSRCTSNTTTSSHFPIACKHYGLLLIMVVALSFSLISNILLNITLISNLQNRPYDTVKINESGNRGGGDSKKDIDLDKPVTHRKIEVKKPTTANSNQMYKGPDFFIAGFPKCGTTTLLYSFLRHNETAISDKEYCRINNGIGDIKKKEALEHLETTLSELNEDQNVKRGIKCPNSIRKFDGLLRLTEVASHQTKLIIGVRHPVLFFQSFYNYRVLEFYSKKLNIKSPSELSKLDEDNDALKKSSKKQKLNNNNNLFNLDIPPAESLIGKKSWNQVSTDMARFDLSLKQLGKTTLSTNELKELSHNLKEDLDDKNNEDYYTVSPTRFKVFLYTVEQLQDKNGQRSKKFRSDMQKFLNLQTPIAPFTIENNNSNVHFPGSSIRICDDKYRNLRSLLVRQGNITKRWIEEKFMASNDVFVSNRPHFLKSIEQWGFDPCSNKST